MKFSVGYNPDDRFHGQVLRHLDALSEVYFPWAGFTTGRGLPSSSDEELSRMTERLGQYRTQGHLKLNLLLNGNCYGHHSQSANFYQRLGDTLDGLQADLGVTAVTTASPMIARFIRSNFPQIHIRASVNMEIGTPEGIEYLLDWFDGFYLKREFNHNMDALQRMREFCHQAGKQLFILANSGCLNFCSARTFHDNLVAHQDDFSLERDEKVPFHSVCSAFLAKPENKNRILSHSNFIRPEDVHLYEGLCDGMKLATRTNINPGAVVAAYADAKWSGNLLELTEPAQAARFYPQIVANDRFPADYAEKRLHCNHQCQTCGYCEKILQSALISFT